MLKISQINSFQLTLYFTYHIFFPLRSRYVTLNYIDRLDLTVNISRRDSGFFNFPSISETSSALSQNAWRAAGLVGLQCYAG